MSIPPIDDGGAGDDEPETALGGPPHPMDRIWRHPSELPSFDTPPARAGTRTGPSKFRTVLTPLGAGAIGALLTVTVLAAAGAFDQHSVTAKPTRATGTPRTQDVIAAAAKRVAPAIVAVRVVGKKGARTGSGVCIRHAGQVLTSDRLVAGASHIEVLTADGTVRIARVVGHDPASDLALLEIDGELDAADLAVAPSLRIGDAVYAVGADSTGTAWVSSGIVSSLDGRVASNGTTMSGLIESNAMIQPWIAGGALLDRQGRVVGILMTPVSGRPATVAVPILLASRVADGLRADGHVDHGWLGLSGKVTGQGQLLITALANGGPSQQAGIQVGDIVVNVDSQPIASLGDLMAAARGHWPGDRIHLEVTRNHHDVTVWVKLSSKPRTPTTTVGTVTTVSEPATVAATVP